MTTRELNATDFLSGLRRLFANPIAVAGIVLAYVSITVLALVNLNRQDVLFPLYSTLAFPPLVLAPFVVLASRIDGRFKLLLVLLLLLVVMPIVGVFDSSYLELVIQICIFAALALGLNIVVGFAGLLDLGYIAFFAVGAYLWGMYTSNVDTYFKINNLLVPASSFYLFLFVGVIVAAIVGILLGLPVLRLRGDYLAIVTLGFGEMIRVLANNFDQPINFTNGPRGLHGVTRPSAQVFEGVITGVGQTLNIPITNVKPLAEQMFFYFIAILIVLVIIIIARRLDNSAIGRAWTAIREDEVAAIAMGVPLVRMKLLAFAMGASFAGAVGVLYAAKQTFVSPESFSLIQSISILAMVIVGGIGGIRGALFGACIVTLLNLQVLKNLSLQINSWRNIDAALPAPIPTIVLLVIAGLLTYAVLRRAPQWYRQWSAWVWRVPVLLIVLGIVAVSFSVGDFRVRDWPTQLEPAKYERMVFGALLILMMIFRPAGLLPEPRRRMELQQARVAEPVEAGEPVPVEAAGGKE